MSQFLGPQNDIMGERNLMEERPIDIETDISPYFYAYVLKIDFCSYSFLRLKLTESPIVVNLTCYLRPQSPVCP